MATAFSADAPVTTSPFDTALTENSGWIYRAQSPDAAAAPVTAATGAADVQTMPPLIVPPQGISTYYPPTYSPGNLGGGAAPFGDPINPVGPGMVNPGVMTQDPWLGGSPQPYAVPAPQYGVNGPQPHRLGWSARYDMWYTPEENLSGVPGFGFGQFAVDIANTYTGRMSNNWVYTFEPQFNYRSYEGISPLMNSGYRFGLGMKLQTPTVSGWSFEVGFNPALATDLESSPSSGAWQFDAHAIAFWRVHQDWTWALGATYWDRADDIVLPYAGAVWTPGPYWEFRLIFPKPRISLFMGTPFGVATWLYAEAEYHVESYEVTPKVNIGTDLKFQSKDWRVVGGLRWETGSVSTFAEAGWVFDRELSTDISGIEIGVDSGFIARVGLRY